MVLRIHGLLASAALLMVAVPSLAAPQRPHVEFFVAPGGSDQASGSAQAPFRSLTRAQAAVRGVNGAQDVVVNIQGGTYALAAPLVFTAKDGGQNGHRVTWQGATPEARPLITSGVAVTGWTLFDRERNIYVADAPKGVIARQLWVNGHEARRARTEIARSDASFTAHGITLSGEAAKILAKAAAEHRLEIEATGFFTHRYAPVERVNGASLEMRQPAWNNNLWGWDTVQNPFHPDQAHLFLTNALAFLDAENEWYLDADAGRIYYKPAAGVDLAQADVQLPRLPLLVSIAGTPQAPIHDLTIKGLQFSYTSWTGPSGPEGYANQQSGAFLTGQAKTFPADALTSCSMGCAAFETVRNTWHQMPSAVQISAAQHVLVEGNVFAHLGQYALGIGNDANANLAGVGLATADVVVRDNLFADLSAGAIAAGGVLPDAHHPSDPRLTNRQLLIQSNLIQSTGKDFSDTASVLATYFDGAIIIHNDISDAPYDAIDVGYGWGYVDRGGNANYLANFRGYDAGMNPLWETPTIRHDVMVAYNRVYKVKQIADDGGAIYNLSACPDCVIAENHVFDIGHRVALYLDEGSRGFMVRNNVVEGPVRQWLNVNTARSALPLRTSINNTAKGNWHDATTVGGIWNEYMNNIIEDDHLVINNAWPAAAQAMMGNAGLEAGNHVPAYRDFKPRPKIGLPPPAPAGSGTYARSDPKGVQANDPSNY